MCEAIVLGCTEIPLLVTDATSPLPTLDSTRLLGTAAVRVSLGEEPFPHWRGGPFALKTQSKQSRASWPTTKLAGYKDQYCTKLSVRPLTDEVLDPLSLSEASS